MVSYNPLILGCRSVYRFECLNCIDEGTYGIVYRARDTESGDIVALKRVKLNREKEGFPITSLREMSILQLLEHPNIIKVKEVVVGSNSDKVFMVMEYMDHEIKALMNQHKFSTSEVKCLMLQLLSAVEHMHSHYIIHRDLKTSNLLLNNRGILKVCDFGLARKYGSPIRPYTGMVVTLYYRAIELLLGEEVYSPAVDMWSVGCIMAEFILGYPLFPGENELDQIAKIFNLLGPPTEEQWPGWRTLKHAETIQISHKASNKLREIFPKVSFIGAATLSDSGLDLISKLLDFNPSTRITAKEAINHEWFSESPLPQHPDYMPTFPGSNERKRY